VIRGGNWFTGPKDVRAASRGDVLARERSILAGFRVVREE
jgi:formylglycine-generating enzyme required for sulfatase activity